MSSGCRPVSFKCWSAATGKPLADVLRGERAPMDALHRQPEAACPNVWQRIGALEHDGRQAGAGPRSRNRPRAWGRARRFMGTAVRPSFLTDRRDDMGVASFRNAACRKGRGKGEGGDVVAAVRGKGRIPASYGGGGGWRVGWKTSLVVVPRYSAFRSEGTKPIRPEGGAHAGIVEDHRPRLGSRPGTG